MELSHRTFEDSLPIVGESLLLDERWGVAGWGSGGRVFFGWWVRRGEEQLEKGRQ